MVKCPFKRQAANTLGFIWRRLYEMFILARCRLALAYGFSKPRSGSVDLKEKILINHQLPGLSILIFFGSFIAILLLGLYVFAFFYNRKSKAILSRFNAQAERLKPTLLTAVPMRYWEDNGGRIRISPNSSCDIYVFNNFLALARRQNFIYNVVFPPILIAANVNEGKSMFDYIDAYKPTSIKFNRFRKDEIDIKLTDPVYHHFRTDITLKKLSEQQIMELGKIKLWVS